MIQRCSLQAFLVTTTILLVSCFPLEPLEDDSYCGDGEINGWGEECDDGAGNSDTMPDACRTYCRLPYCGDGVVDSDESCEHGWDPVPTCVSEGYSRGTRRCSATCQLDLTHCSLCGDNVAEGTVSGRPWFETCDGDDLRQQSCASLGRGSGTLRCSGDCTWDVSDCGDPTPRCGNGQPELPESCDDGNTRDHDGCSSRCVVEIPTIRSTATATQLPVLRSAAVAHDAHRGRTVVFGGENYDEHPDYEYAPTWEFDGTSWLQKNTAHSPSRRQFAAITYDFGRHRMVLWGGSNTAWDPEPFQANDTWEYDGVDWIESTPANSPSPRRSPGIAHDIGRGRTVLFGGYLTASEQYTSETWEYDGTHWTRIDTPTTPPARRPSALVYDAARAEVVLYGGSGGDHNQGEFVDYYDTWEYDGVDWQETTSPTTPTTTYWPSVSLVFDGTTRRLVLFLMDEFNPSRIATWEYDGLGWSETTPVALLQLANYDHAFVYNPTKRACVLHIGKPYTQPTEPYHRTWLYQWAEPE